MLPVFEQLDTRDADSVIAALRAGTEASRSADCRRGSCDVIGPFSAGDADATLIATGDIHDNPVHLARIVQAAGLDDPGRDGPRSHLTLHELIHSDRVSDGIDFSYRVLARAAVLKAAFPELVHVLLANHELAQLLRSEVLKDGVRCVAAFREGLAASFDDRAEDVEAEIDAFIRSMPLALRVRVPAGNNVAGGTDVLCAHSLPAPELMDRFDPGVLDRELTDDDLTPRRGSAHLMVWGRSQTANLVASLGKAWGVGLFILGHEYAPQGRYQLSDRALVVNSDHPGGGFLRLPLHGPANAADAERAFERLN